MALFDPADFIVKQSASCSGTGCVIKVVNIMGFFIEGVCDDVAARGKLETGTKCGAHPNKDVVGRIMVIRRRRRPVVLALTRSATALSRVIRLVR